MQLQSELYNILPNIEKEPYVCTFKRYREKRSLDANAYFHLLVHKLAEKLGLGNDECKVKMNLEYGTIAKDKSGNQVLIKLPAEVDITQFYEYARFYAQREEKGVLCNYYLLYKQTHTLNTKEMSRLINGVVEECQAVGIDTRTQTQINEMLSLWRDYE